MPIKNPKQARRQKLRWRIRKKIKGTATRPRLAIYKSLTTIYTQLIDDTTAHTLVAADSRVFKGKSIAHAEKTATLLAQKAKEKNINQVVLDRSGYRHHGVVKQISQTAKAEGLQH